MKGRLVSAWALAGLIACSDPLGSQTQQPGQQNKGTSESAIPKHEHSVDELKKVAPRSLEFGPARDAIDLIASDLFCFIKEKEPSLTVKFGRRNDGSARCSEISFHAVVPAANAAEPAKHRVLYYTCEAKELGGKLRLHRKLMRLSGEAEEDKLVCGDLDKFVLASPSEGKEYKLIEKDISFPTTNAPLPRSLQLDLYISLTEGAEPKLIRRIAEIPQ